MEPYTMTETLIAETEVASTKALAEVVVSNLATPHKGRKLHLLLLENNPSDRAQILLELRSGGFDVRCEVVETALHFRAQLQNGCPDVVLANYNLGQWKGMEALAILRKKCLETPLIIVSGEDGGSKGGRMH
ncbi:MAG: response regulator [Acidobacteriota bacterium]|nr:response regulator [Acidobacteriota bacterium]